MYSYLIFLVGIISASNAELDLELPLGVTPVPGGLSGNGVSSRYWDCCKPSCSWMGNLPNQTNNKPVRSCKADGVTTIGQEVQSGCATVGSSFMCVDQAPFAVSNNLAYGFAGFSHQGGAYVGRCCSCFLLQFQGALHGKSMIVQTTNTGVDAVVNQFDIAMPGGGVGLLNGCTKQWHAPANGWGDRYGGVHSAAECNQLPSKMQKGCKFRWTFMNGVSNPDVKFQEVVCPKQITDISGCHA